MSNPLTLPASMLAPAPPSNALDTIQGANPTATPTSAPKAAPQIDYDALAKQSGAVSSSPAVDYDAIAKQSGAVSSQPQPQPQQPSLGSRVWQGAQESAPGRAITSALTPPQTHAEDGIFLVGGAPALQAWRAANSIVDSAKGLAKASANEYPQAKQDFQHTVQDFHNGNWRNAASSAVSTAADVGGIVQPEMVGTAQNIRELSEGARPGGNLATPLTRQVIDATTALAPELAARAPGAVAAASDVAKSAASGVKQVVAPTAEVAGEDFATRPLRNTVNQGAGTRAVQNIADQTTSAAGATPSGQPTSLRDVFQEPIAAKQAVAKTFYDALDDASDNQWTANQKALANVRKEIQMKGGLNDDTDAALNAKKIQYEWQQEQIIDKAVKDGMPADVADQARSNWYAKSRLEDVQDIFNKKSNVSGPRPEMTTPGVKLHPEQYNFKSIAKDLNAMDPDDLTKALGSKEGAQNLVTTVNLAAKQGWATGKGMAAIRTGLQLAGFGHIAGVAESLL